MKKVLWSVLFAAILTGCAGPRYKAFSSIEAPTSSKVVIRNNPKVRIGFQEAIESWLKTAGYEYIVVPAESQYDLDKISLEYTGLWQFHWISYLGEARITALTRGQKVGQVEYKAPNLLNNNKYGNAEERIKYMMAILFKKMTPEDATKLINGEQPAAGAAVPAAAREHEEVRDGAISTAPTSALIK